MKGKEGCGSAWLTEQIYISFKSHLEESATRVFNTTENRIQGAEQ